MYICIYIERERERESDSYPYLSTSLLGQDMTQGQFLRWSLTGLNL